VTCASPEKARTEEGTFDLATRRELHGDAATQNRPESFRDETCQAPNAEEDIGITAGEDIDSILIPVRAEMLRASVRSDAAGPVRIQRRMVREAVESTWVEGDAEIRVSRQFITRRGISGEPAPVEQIIIEIPLPEGMTPAEMEADGMEEIIVTHEIVQRTERVTGTVRREDVTVSGENQSAT
jgi:hypothetical protein